MIQKIGTGYDIHRLVNGRKLILGGVEIPFEKGLDGHSDADVLVHAICDALLGALGKGDIGAHFPNTEVKYKNISSLVLLSQVNDIIKKEGFTIGNIDTAVLAERPNLKSYKPSMRGAIARALGIEEKAVNIKATTQEGLGSVGQGEAIAAFASVLLIK